MGLIPRSLPQHGYPQTGAWDPEEDELLYYWQVRGAANERAHTPSGQRVVAACQCKRGGIRLSHGAAIACVWAVNSAIAMAVCQLATRGAVLRPAARHPTGSARAALRSEGQPTKFLLSSVLPLHR
jgi:hypothetical protein